MLNANSALVRREFIVGSKRWSNYVWTLLLFGGGSGFLLAGLSSYLKINLLFFTNSTDINFLPQGIVMTFYGIFALSLSLYVGLTIWWDIGGGYNEFNKEDQLVRIARNGFPGKNRQILLVYSMKNIQSIRLSIQEGINPKRMIYLCTKDQRQIPLTQVEQPRSLVELESQASDLAKFLEVSLEGL